MKKITINIYNFLKKILFLIKRKNKHDRYEDYIQYKNIIKQQNNIIDNALQNKNKKGKTNVKPTLPHKDKSP